MTSFLTAWVLTVVIEGVLVLGYCRLVRRSPLPLLGIVLLLNGITQLLLWGMLLWRGATAYWAVLLPAEGLIWLFEGWGLNAYLRIGWKSWILSLWLNGISFGVGLALPV